jgi:drug/metabolite transporter (DMT)-like permease
MATMLGLLAILLWGMLALLGNLAETIPPFQLLSICFAISGSLLFIKRAIYRQPLLKKASLTRNQWLIGIAGLFGFHLCYFIALRHAPAIDVSIIVYLWPLLLTVLVAKKRQRSLAILGGSIGFTGIIVLVSKNASISINETTYVGYLLALICALIWSSYSWYLSKSKNHVDDIGWLSIAVAIFAIAAHFIFEDTKTSMNLSEWMGILLLGVGPAGGAFYLWEYGLKHGNTRLIASCSFAAPLISSVVLSLAGLNPWSIQIIISLLMILLGAYLCNLNLTKSTR